MAKPKPGDVEVVDPNSVDLPEAERAPAKPDAPKPGTPLNDIAKIRAAEEKQFVNPRAVRPNTMRGGDFQALEFAYADFSAVIPAGWTYEETLAPNFWTNIVGLLAPNKSTGQPDRSGAIIHLRRRDNAFYAKMYVRAVLGNGLIVQCIGPSLDPKTGRACPIDLKTGLAWTGGSTETAGNLRVQWSEPRNGFDVVRSFDGQSVAPKVFVTAEAADEWMRAVQVS